MERDDERGSRPAPSDDARAQGSLADDELAARLAWIRSEILPSALRCETRPDGIAWELADRPGLAETLDALAARERACCPGIELRHGPGSAPGRLRLEMRGVDPHSAFFAGLRRTG